MPKATKTTKVSCFSIEITIENEKNVSEVLTPTFSKNAVHISDGRDIIEISRQFLPEFIAALQTTYPDAFALIDKHQKTQKTTK